MHPKAVVVVLAQVAVALTLMLAGWGFDDVSGFFSHPARAGLVGVALAGLAWIFAWRLEVNPLRAGRRPVGWQRLGLVGLMVIGFSLVFFLPYGDRRGVLTFEAPAWVRYLGLGLYAAGNAIAILALRELGRQYSGYVTLQEDHRLVQTGIYGLIRHPIYLRAVLVMVGLPLLFRSWLILLTVPIGAAFVTTRIVREERLLSRQFGVEFEGYKERTRRLIPYLL